MLEFWVFFGFLSKKLYVFLGLGSVEGIRGFFWVLLLFTEVSGLFRIFCRFLGMGVFDKRLFGGFMVGFFILWYWEWMGLWGGCVGVLIRKRDVFVFLDMRIRLLVSVRFFL